MTNCDCIIVGSGFAGAVVAERLHTAGKKVLVIERRSHIGGNSFDKFNDDGVLVHEYGPHYFRTNNAAVFEYLSRFTRWRKYEARIRACVGNKLYPLPINRTTLNEFFNVKLASDDEAMAFLDARRERIPNPANAEEQVLATVGRELYESFFKNYTRKQWNIPASDLDASVTARIPVRYNTDDRYFNDRFQAMPADGYHVLFKNLLEGIEIWNDTDYFEVKDDLSCKLLVFTGQIDEFFAFKHGSLPYRSLSFDFETHDTNFYQDYVQVNYPNDNAFTRIVEIKHATGQTCKNTTIVKEYPQDHGIPLYPIPRPAARALYDLYNQDARQLRDVKFLGRLATYRYLNMDQVVLDALDFVKTYI